MVATGKPRENVKRVTESSNEYSWSLNSAQNTEGIFL
jgi:hypothetical protein